MLGYGVSASVTERCESIGARGAHPQWTIQEGASEVLRVAKALRERTA